MRRIGPYEFGLPRAATRAKAPGGGLVVASYCLAAASNRNFYQLSEEDELSGADISYGWGESGELIGCMLVLSLR
jgi:hypothetical protein